MTLSSLIKVAEIVGIVLGAAAFALVTYWKMKDKALTKERGLMDNPERCKDHEDRLRAIEGRLATISTNIVLIKFKLGMPEDDA